jgi:hypothetical protein
MKHLDDVNETYWQHFKFASMTGLVLIIAGVLVIVHAIYPNICKSVGSDVIRHLHKILEERNDK